MFREAEDGPVVHEDFYVLDVIWDWCCPGDRTGPEEDGYVLCIPCFEIRLGRKLVHADFKCGPSTELGGWAYIPSSLFLARWASDGQGKVGKRTDITIRQCDDADA
jgi:hypothetical protein